MCKIRKIFSVILSMTVLISAINTSALVNVSASSAGTNPAAYSDTASAAVETEDFNDIPEEYNINQWTDKDGAKATDKEKFNTLYGWSVEGTNAENIGLVRVAGASGAADDYAIAVVPYSGSSTENQFMYTRWTKPTSGIVVLDYDLKLGGLGNAANWISMAGFPSPSSGNHHGVLGKNDAGQPYFVDTDRVYQSSSWVHMHYEYNVTENTCSLKIDNTDYWTSRACNPTQGWVNLGQFGFSQLTFLMEDYKKEGSCYIAIDNFSLYTKEDTSHPRLYVTAERIKEIKENIANDNDINLAYNTLITMCNSYNDDYIQNNINMPSGRTYGVITKATGMVKELGFAYQLTGNTLYKDRAWKVIEKLLSWDNWGEDIQYLDPCAAMPNLAYGYDMIYPGLTAEQREVFASGLKAKYLDYAKGVYDGTNAANGGFDKDDSRLKQSNWGAVCATGNIMASLMLMDYAADGSELKNQCEYIKTEALKILKNYSLNLIKPSGSSYEGVIYTEYYLSNIIRAGDALMRICGDDEGLLSADGIGNAMEYFAYINTPNGIFAYSETEQRKPYFPTVMYQYAYLSGDTQMISNLNYLMEYFGVDFSYEFMPYADTGKYSEIGTSLPLDNVDEGQQKVTMRSSWTDNDAMYISALGGKNASGMTHYDKGSFIFETNGVRWFDDMGHDNYEMAAGYWNPETRLKLYRLRTEGHNCVVINPTQNDYGQRENAEASLESFDSSLAGALAVYDLGAVYSNDVTAYRRGIRTTDDRKTAIIQDEITLKNSNSTVYWFAHSEVDSMKVSDDGKSVIMQDGNKKLKVEFIVNRNFKLGIADAKSLHNISAEGEYPRDSWKKISLKIENASGNVWITAKLTPIDGTEYPSPTGLGIDNWGNSTEKYIYPYIKTDGINAHEIIYEDAGTSYLMCDAPGSIKAEFYIDNTPVGSYNNTSGTGAYKAYYDMPSPSVGTHKFKVKSYYNDGSAEKTIDFKYTKKLRKAVSPMLDTETADFDNLPDLSAGGDNYMICSDAQSMLDDANIPFEVSGENVYIGRAPGRYSTQVNGDYSLCILPYGTGGNPNAGIKLNGIPDGGISAERITIEFDWKASFDDANNGFNISLTGLGLADYPDIKSVYKYSGIYGSHLVPQKGKWIHMRYEYDTANDILTVYAEDEDGNTMTKSSKTRKGLHKLNEFIICPQFWSEQSGMTREYWAAFYLDNFKISLWDSTETDITVFSDESKANADVLFAAFNNNELVSIKKLSADLEMGANKLNFADLDIAACDTVKVFVWGDTIRPLTIMTEYKNIE